VVVVTEGKRHDVRVARTLRLDPGTIVVMDRGYVDYAWFGRLTTAGVFFVTRLKDNAAYTVVERRPVPERSAILRDEIIELTGVAAGCAGRGGRSRAWRHPGLPDQPPELGSHDDCRHLQGPVADRAVLLERAGVCAQNEASALESR
jgi:hypothetical protein